MIRKYIAVAVFLLSAAVMAAALLHAGRYASLCFVARTPAAATATNGEANAQAAEKGGRASDAGPDSVSGPQPAAADAAGAPAGAVAKGDGVPEAAATEVRGTAVPGSVDSGGALSGAAPVRGERSDAAASAPQGVR